MTRSPGHAQAANYFDSGAFPADLTRQITFRAESQRAGPCPDLRARNRPDHQIESTRRQAEQGIFRAVLSSPQTKAQHPRSRVSG